MDPERLPRDVTRLSRDPAEFEAFYRRHVAAVTRFVARRVADPHTVADLTAEVFLAAIGSAHIYHAARGSQLGRLYGITRDIVASERRRAALELRVAGRICGRRLLDSDDIAALFEVAAGSPESCSITMRWPRRVGTASTSCWGHACRAWYGTGSSSSIQGPTKFSAPGCSSPRPAGLNAR